MTLPAARPSSVTHATELRRAYEDLLAAVIALHHLGEPGDGLPSIAELREWWEGAQLWEREARERLPGDWAG